MADSTVVPIADSATPGAPLTTDVERPAYATGVEEVLHGACPFACCRYGNWTMPRGGTLRATYSPNSDSVAKIAEGARVRADSGLVIIHTVGLGVLVSDPPPMSGMPRVADTVEILNTAGEGVHRVKWHGAEFELPTSLLQVIREPYQSWWVYMTDVATQRSGWIMVSGMAEQPNQPAGDNACGR